MNCEIVELTEKDECEGNFSEIHKLFETLDMSTSSPSLCSRASSQKRPMRNAPVLGIGFSDPLSLKQALRGLCISQASEMAVSKKWSCNPSDNETKHGFDEVFGRREHVSVFSEGLLLQNEYGMILQPVNSPVFAIPDNVVPVKKSSMVANFFKRKRLCIPNYVTKVAKKEIPRSKENSSESSKNSTIGECSSGTSYSEESNPSSCTSRELRWKAIKCIEKQQGQLNLKNFKLLRKLGNGDTATVYLCQLISTSCCFAIKVMDTECLNSSEKLLRVQTEIDILKILNHPFLPTLYANFTASKFTCLVIDYCPGGDLRVNRQRQLTKRLSENTARFYVAEVVVALEYLHILGVVHRDLKPENILIGEDGHIMLSYFDLSIKCAVNAESSCPNYEEKKKNSGSRFVCSCMNHFCFKPSSKLHCYSECFSTAKSATNEAKPEQAYEIISLPQPAVDHSNYEYVAPEIIKGEGYGFSVDWWALGIVLYELLYGETPFKGASNKDTVNNVIFQSIKFPESPAVSCHVRDLMTQLLKKEAVNRIGSAEGADEIKKHSFFRGLNWALIREERPPLSFCYRSRVEADL